mgnify:CR=1 FL=1
MSDDRAGTHVPSAMAAEAAVLSVLAQFPGDILPLLREEQVSEGWFWASGHREFYRLIIGELDAGRRVDFITLATRARDLGIEHAIAIEIPGESPVPGVAAVSRLFANDSFATHHFGTYLDELREKFLARELYKLCADTQKLITANWQSAGIPLVRDTLARVSELASYGVRNDSVQHIKPLVIEAVERAQTRYNARGHALGLPTGIAALDRSIDGLKKAHGYYIGGRPAMGKSAFMGDLIDFIGTNPDPYAQAHCLCFSLEMTGLQLVQRSVMKGAGLSQQRIRDGLMSEKRGDFLRLTASAGVLAQSRIHVDDSANLTIEDIIARTRRFVRKLRARETDEDRARREKSDRPDVVVFLDYLQRVKGCSKRGRENRYLEIAEICQGISSLIKDLKIAAVVICQLGRADNEGPDRYPSLSDFRESGDIEAEAHVALALHRPDYYLVSPEKKEAWCGKRNKGADEEGGTEFQWRVGTADSTVGMGGRDLAHYALAVVLKQREGMVGEIPLHFEPGLAKFTNWNEHEKSYSTAAEAQQGALLEREDTEA